MGAPSAPESFYHVLQFDPEYPEESVGFNIYEDDKRAKCRSRFRRPGGVQAGEEIAYQPNRRLELWTRLPHAGASGANR